MPANDLTQAEMSLVTERLIDEHLDLLEQTPYLQHMVEPIRSLMQSFVDDQVDPQAEVRAAAAVVQRHTARFDDQIRAIDHLLTGFALLADDPEQRTRIQAAHAEVLPDGRQIVNRTAGDKAAEGRLMEGRLRGDTEEVLGELWVGNLTLLTYIRRDLFARAEQLGDAQAERLDAEARSSRRVRGYNLETRRTFLQIESGLRTLLDIHDAEPELRETLLGFVDRMVRQAERRAAQRRNNEEQGLPPALQLDPIVDPAAAPSGAAAAGQSPAADASSSSGAAQPAGDADRGGSSSDTRRG